MQDTIRSSIKQTSLFGSFPNSTWKMPRFSFLYGISILIVLLALLPVAFLIMRALGAGEAGIEYLFRERTINIIFNSIKLMVAVSLSAALIGVPFAWLTTRTNLPYRKVWLVLGLLPMVVPSYLSTVTFIAVLGPKGILQGWLAPFGITELPEIYGFFGAWLAITLFTYPYVVLPVRAALLNLDPALEEAAHSLGLSRWRVFMRVTLPQLRPAIAGGTLLAALYSLSDFGAVAMMRYNVFTRAIYLQYTSSFNRERAAILALVLIALTLTLLLLERYYSRNTKNYRVGVGAQRQIKQINLNRWRIPALLFVATPIILGVIIPVGVMLWWLTGRVMVESVPVSMTNIATNAVYVSFIAALVVAVAAMPLGMLSARAKSRFSRTLVSMSYIGNVLPGIVIGLALVFFGIRYLPGLYQTMPILIMGYGIRYLPFSVGATRSALTQVNPCYEEAARSLGMKPHQVAWRITFPLVRTGVISGGVLVFLSVMKELPTTLILAPLGFRTLATRIWSVHTEAQFVLIGLPGLVLVTISAVSLWLIIGRERQSTNAI
ncbi:MAG: iron ABC transporter permease [Aggregatilineales bacterium]